MRQLSKPLTIHDLPRTQRPRERLQTLGPTNLTNEELIAILLGSGTKRFNVLRVAKTILQQFSPTQLLEVQPKALKTIKGIGPVQAGKLIACMELAKRCYQPIQSKQLKTPSEVIAEVTEIATDRREHLIALYLNARQELVEKQTLAIGNLNQAILEARDVFATAFTHPCAFIILVHNHPSNDPEPSESDLTLTRKLTEAGKMLGIQILDHIIVTKKDYYSFKENCLL